MVHTQQKKGGPILCSLFNVGMKYNHQDFKRRMRSITIGLIKESVYQTWVNIE